MKTQLSFFLILFLFSQTSFASNLTQFFGGGSSGGSEDSFTVSEINSNTTMVVGNSYVVNPLSNPTLTMPAACTVGNKLKIISTTNGAAYTLNANTGQKLLKSGEHNSLTASGVSQVVFVCSTANSKWAIDKMTGTGNLTSCAATSATYLHTGGIVNYTLPAGCGTVTIEAWGGDGGTNTNTPAALAGRGAYIKGTVSVTPASTIKILVAGKGGNGSISGGGGGGSFVTTSANAPLIIAGGGGGTANGSNGQDASLTTSGGTASSAGGTSGNGGAASGAQCSAGGGLSTDGTNTGYTGKGYAFVNGGSGGGAGGSGGGGGFGGGSGGEWSSVGCGGSGGGYSGGGAAGGSTGGAGGGSFFNGATSISTGIGTANMNGYGKVVIYVSE